TLKFSFTLIFLNKLRFKLLKIGPCSGFLASVPNGVPNILAAPGPLMIKRTSFGVTALNCLTGWLSPFMDQNPVFVLHGAGIHAKLNRKLASIWLIATAPLSAFGLPAN